MRLFMQYSSRNTNSTTSASCSIEPDSRRSSCGRLSSRDSTCRESWESAIIGTSSSFANALRPVVISVISCTRLSDERLPEPEEQLQVVDDQEVQAALALQPAGARRRAGRSRCRRSGRCRTAALHLLGGGGDALELVGVDVAAADQRGGDAGLLGDDAGGELLGRHFEREEADDAAVLGLQAAVGERVAAVGPGDVVGDVGGERGFAHRRAAGEDDSPDFCRPPIRRSMSRSPVEMPERPPERS